MGILEDIQYKFGTVKKVGADGEHLANELRLMMKHMENVIIGFEEGMQSEEWTNNFAAFGGDDALVWAQGVYRELKETEAKLKEMGL